MPITINGSGTIGGLSVGGLPDGTVDRDTLAAQAAGRILQVMEVNTSTEVINATTAYVDTGLSATITPASATSKILIFVDQQFSCSRSSAEQGIGLRLYRDATLIYDPITNATGPLDYYASFTGATATFIAARAHHNLLDSPSTTNAVTYKTQGRPYITTGSVAFQDATVGVNGSSRIILMEVAA